MVPKNVLPGQCDYPPEGLNARCIPGCSKPSVVKRKPGRKRRGPNMKGRNPFKAIVNKLLTKREKVYEGITVKADRRRYNVMERELRSLYEEGEIVTMSPEKMTYLDVDVYAGFLKNKRMSAKGQLHNISALKNLLQFVGNNAVGEWKGRCPDSVPRNYQKMLPSLNEKEYQRILEESIKVKDYEWRRLLAYALVITALNTGTRPKEIRLCNIDDVDTVNWKLMILHPKAEKTYGKPRQVDIRSDAQSILKRFLDVRRNMVQTKCPNGNRALFPALSDKEGDGYYSGNGIQKLKTIVEKDTGIRFDVRKCRRTFGQMGLDKGLSLDTVAALMGHKTPVTTGTYYCGKRQDDAIRESKKAFSGFLGYPDAKTSSTDSKFEVTGYV